MKWLKVKEELEGWSETAKTGNCISGVWGGSVCDQTEQEGQEKETANLPFLAPQQERKQKRKVLTKGGLIGSPQRKHWQLRSYQMFCTAGNTGSFSPPDKGSPIADLYPSLFTSLWWAPLTRKPLKTSKTRKATTNKQRVVCSKLGARNKNSHALQWCNYLCSCNWFSPISCYWKAMV